VQFCAAVCLFTLAILAGYLWSRVPGVQSFTRIGNATYVVGGAIANGFVIAYLALFLFLGARAASTTTPHSFAARRPATARPLSSVATRVSSSPRPSPTFSR